MTELKVGQPKAREARAHLAALAPMNGHGQGPYTVPTSTPLGKGHTGPVTTPASLDPWDPDRIRQIVTQNDLERGWIEYKRQLDDGRKTLEAITTLANTFGGVVLIGVDEDEQGLDRLTGVPATERTRLVSLCWSQLTPPFSPEIISISLGRDPLASQR